MAQRTMKPVSDVGQMPGELCWSRQHATHSEPYKGKLS